MATAGRGQACRRRVGLGEPLDGELLEEVFGTACREQGVVLGAMGLAFRAEAQSCEGAVASC